VLTDGSTYAPQMPWFMSHYCDSQFKKMSKDVQDPACYADYLSPMNSGFNFWSGQVQDWPNNGAAWSVFPSTPPNMPPRTPNHCGQGLTVCTIVMGDSISSRCRRR
jgi:hypothetical protein